MSMFNYISISLVQRLNIHNTLVSLIFNVGVVLSYSCYAHSIIVYVIYKRFVGFSGLLH